MLALRIYKKLYITVRKVQLKILYSNRITMGKGLSFLKGFKVVFEGEGKIVIGDGCFFNYNCSLSCIGKIEIGSDCMFGENVKLYDHNHRFSDPLVKFKDQGFKIGSIKIGNNCWVGSNVTILNNVTIGDNVVIGANCLIYKSIPSNTVVKNNSELLLEERKERPQPVVNPQSGSHLLEPVQG
ncbi:acyltransferase [Paenibacillus mendelii]|uniref:Acyltransferase n=1 Tax=Paenibacillus mendelii TaxID=206163 RepID=A0ABV6JJ59_9BACL|nr:acyltransferase [Paenibacillus mendelii]MCQ6558874.1 acyltransferase [Paenibacillus mendelii]